MQTGIPLPALMIFLLALPAAGGLSGPCARNGSLSGQKTPPGISATANAGAVLDFSIAASAFVTGESIPFTITLNNNGHEPASVVDGSPANRAFSVRVAGKGFQADGNTASLLLREGENVEEPRSPSRQTLAPGGRLAVSGDMIQWIGDLAPGVYTCQARYFGSSGAALISRPIEIRISEAAISYVRPTRANVFLSHEGMETVWINRTASGSDLFLLQSSSQNPAVAYANRRITRLQEEAPAVASSYNSAGQPARHIVWISPRGRLNVVRISGGVQSQPASASLPSPGLELVGAPFTGRDGTLHAAFVDPAGVTITLFQWRDLEEPVFTPISVSQPLRRPLCVLWGRDEVPAIAWVGQDEKSVVAMIAGNNADRSPRTVSRTPGQILDIAMSLRGRDNGAPPDRLVTVLLRDPATNELVRTRIDMASGKTDAQDRFRPDPAALGRLIDSAIGADLSPRYLFAAADGVVRLLGASFSRMLPVLTATGRPVKISDLPSLVISNPFGRRPETYVRVVEGGRRFSYCKVE